VGLPVSSLSLISCPSATLCVATGADAGNDLEVFVSQHPSGGSDAWQGFYPPSLGPFVSGLSCPSVRLCVLGDYAGKIDASTDPLDGGSWRFVRRFPADSLGPVSCPSVHFCATVDGRTIFTSRDPVTASSWHGQVVDKDRRADLTGVSCPAARLCIAADSDGNGLFSRTPTRGGWTTRRSGCVRSGNSRDCYSLQVTCPSVKLCLAFPSQGSEGSAPILVTANPASGWHRARVPRSPITAASCPSARLCLAVTGASGGSRSGYAFTTDDPLHGRWRGRPIARYDVFSGVSCPAASRCFAVDHSGHVFISADPQAGAPPWRAVRIDRTAELVGIACPTTGLCLAIDRKGGVLSSTDPSGGPSAWSRVQLFSGSALLTAITCPSARLCLAAGSDLFTTTDPTGGARAWKAAGLRAGLTTVACASVKLCAAGDLGGTVWSSSAPAGGASAWHRVYEPDTGEETSGVFGLSCPSLGLCVVAYNDQYQDYIGGNISASTDPTGPSSTWQPQRSWDTLGTRYTLGPLVCASTSLCLAVNGNGFFTSTTPTGGPSAWGASEPDLAGDMTAVSCLHNTTTCVAVDDTGHVLTSH
jgi:hypothetical protein